MHMKEKFELYVIRGWNTTSVADALELLGCDDNFVSAYAVQEFDYLANDKILCMYMLQLTQALKAEPIMILLLRFCCDELLPTQHA